MSAGMTLPLLAFENVSKSFDGLEVIVDLSFSVEPGERVALIGPNGAGKTTVFNLVSGVYPLTKGFIMLNGVDVATVPSRHRAAMGIARTFQNIRLMPHLTVVENVMLGQRTQVRGWADMLAPLGSWARSGWRAAAQQHLAAFGLDEYQGVVANLPYGIRKKIEVVRALVAKPKILLLDEPAAGLNPKETEDLNTFLLGVAATGVTLLVVEHDMNLVRGLCQRTVVLNFGRKIYDGPTDCVHDDATVLEAYLGRKGAQQRTRRKAKTSTGDGQHVA